LDGDLVLTSLRIAKHPVLSFAGRRRVIFDFDGQSVEACEGETLGAALHATGRHILSRSFKYHRPRGLLCVAGRCPNCLVNVNGQPNVRACVTPVQDGMRVRHQNAWPSLGADALAVVNKLDFLLPVGFYYKTFIRPRALWPLYEKALRHAAGLGVVDFAADGRDDYEVLHLHADVLVVGGGPAGMAAGLEAAQAGARVILLEAEAALGGHLRHDLAQHEGGDGLPAGRGFEVARHLAAAVQREPNVTVHLETAAFGVYEGNMVGAEQGGRLLKIRYRHLVVAAGAFERPLVFANNDLPGIFLASGAQRLMHLHGVRPGRRAVVISANDYGLSVAADLLEAGVRVEAVADVRAAIPAGLAASARLRDARVPVLPGHTIIGAHGVRHVRSAVVAAPVGGADWRGGREIPCDCLCLAGGFEPAAALLHQAVAMAAGNGTGGGAGSLPPAVRAAGAVHGVWGLQAQVLDGRLAGAEAALALGLGGQGLRRRGDAWRRARDAGGAAGAIAAAGPILAPTGQRDKRIVCLCEDVTEKDLARAIAEGFDHIETLKRYSTISMGPCQGKMCLAAAIAVCARETGHPAPEVGSTTPRPPVQPVTLGALAGRRHPPRKLSPIHQQHVALGATFMDMGPWLRPRHFTDPLEEARVVRERVGIIDVTPLGKLEVVGGDAVRLLEKVYPNRFADLKVGRIRYGLVCDDAGIILDDGTVGRLAEDRFFITTTTGGVEAVEQWITWWAAGTGWCAHVRDITDAYAAINLAGPRARDVLRKLTDMDVSAAALPYLAVGQGSVAGVPTLLLRIGFVGELGYEMHFPAEYGDHMWAALMEAGREHGIAPFGVEAQRILRMEKGHIIVGHDTDALSNPIEADMAWIAKMDKPDFIGRPGIAAAQARGRESMLVGFEILQEGVLPAEGCQIVEDGRSVGRVTSCKFSPAGGKVMGMAWVPVGRAEPGSPIAIRWEGKDVPARVVKLPFYDPTGARMKA
jgi:sarcosine oxidase subunit alpha